MVALVFKPGAVGRGHDLQPLGARAFMRRNLLPHPVHQDLGPAPGDGTQPRVHQAAKQFFQTQPVVFGHKKNLRRRKAVHRQAEVPDEAHQFQVIGQRQLRVEAPLEQDAAAAVVLEFHELGRQAVPVKDVAVVGPGRPVKSAETAARYADIGVVDIPVDDEGDPVAGIETPAHLIGRGPQGQEVQVPQFLRLGRIETFVLF